MSNALKYKMLSSEKSHKMRSINTVVYQTRTFITKPEMVSFLETVFSVKVLDIKSVTQKGKVKIRKRIKVQLPDRKKFYVRVDNLEKLEEIENKNAKEV